MRISRTETLDDPYPASDGKPMAETQVHVQVMASRYEMLRLWLRPRGIYLAANMFLYYKKGDIKARKSPDIMAVKGVNVDIKRRSFKTWEEKAVPCWVLELTSKKTAKEDQGEKKELYRKLQVREYFMFDPLHDYLPEHLMGFRLVGGDYQRMEPEADGGLTSEELGLRFVPEGDQLAVFDAQTGERILSLEEMHEETEKLAERLESLQEHNQDLAEENRVARRRAREAQKKLEEEQRKLDEQARQIANMEVEIAQLKAALKAKANGRH